MSNRFYSAEPIIGERATLGGPEAHHLLHVMRIPVGERVTLFDGSGAEFSAEVTVCGRSTADLRIVERRDVDRELSFTLIVGVSLPKGDRQKWLVEKLTELGVTALVPLATDRGVAQPTDAALERLERSVIEASKQCGRNRLMRVAKPQAWGKWISRESRDSGNRCLAAHPGGASLSTLNLSTRMPTSVSIGPEGGFTDEEIASAAAVGWKSVDLGPRMLRVETAALALSAAVVAVQVGP